MIITCVRASCVRRACVRDDMTAGLESMPRTPDDLARAVVGLAGDQQMYQRLSNGCLSNMQEYEPNRSVEIITPFSGG